jgi:P4 family phage/plasmid primase-like protien
VTDGGKRAPISPAALEDLKSRNPVMAVAARYVALRQHGAGKMIGPCPACSKDRQSKRATKFECDAERWVCAKCHEAGDVIKLVALAEGLDQKRDFLKILEILGGAREPDPAAAAAHKRNADLARKKRDDAAAYYRERERGSLFDLWHEAARAGDDRPGMAEAFALLDGYGARRQLGAMPAGIVARIAPALAYWNHGGKGAKVIYTGPALLLPIRRAGDGKFGGLHQTWLDLAQPKGKAAIIDPASGAPMPSKKIRGSKAGGRIEIVAVENPHTLVIGEGFETVLAAWRALTDKGRDLAGWAFWSAVDLGNLSGKALESVPHPSARTEAGRVQKVPGPVPDAAAAGVPIPASVTRLIILADGDSDRFTTQCAIARACARYARPGLTVAAAWPYLGMDFNDMLADPVGDSQAAGVVRAIDAAAPFTVADVEGLATGDKDQPAAAASGRAIQPSPAADAAPAATFADLPSAVFAAAAVFAASSQMGGSENAGENAGLERMGARRGTREKLAAAQAGADTRQQRRAGKARKKRRDGIDPLDLKLAFYPQTDLGNAERFAERNRDRLIWVAEIGWHWWDGKRWSRAGANEIVLKASHECVRAIQDEAAALAASKQDKAASEKGNKVLMASDLLSLFGRASEANSKLANLDKQAQPYLAVARDRLDADPYKFNVDNGTICAVTNRRGGWSLEFKPHDPADLITKISPVAYDREATSPTYDAFLSEVQPHADKRRMLHQWKGLSLTGAPIQALMMFYGKGANGKSTFEDITGYVAGDYALAVPIETFLNNGRSRNAGQASPDLAQLPGVRMLRTSEPDKGVKLSEALIKQVTGGDPIGARHLNMPFFWFVAVFKLTISGNYKPKIDGTDEGIWRRVRLVPWRVTIAKARRDLNLGNKLKAEAPGVLNHMLKGLLDFLRNGLVEDRETEEATAEYRRDSDQLGRFLEQCVVRDPDARTQVTEFHRTFIAWCRVNAGTEWTQKGLAGAMKERGFESKQSNVMWWLGCRLLKKESDFVDRDGNPIASADTDRALEKVGDDAEFAG